MSLLQLMNVLCLPVVSALYAHTLFFVRHRGVQNPLASDQGETVPVFLFYLFILGCRGVPNLFRGASLGPRALLQERSRHLSALPGERKHLLLPFLQGDVLLNFF
jgi:hypothetical protein